MNMMCSGSLCLELEKIILQDDEALPEDQWDTGTEILFTHIIYRSPDITVQSQNIPHDYSEVRRKMRHGMSSILRKLNGMASRPIPE